MATRPPSLVDLSLDDRSLVESWLEEFETSWTHTRLANRVQSLPPAGNPLRSVALTEMVKIDLERQWADGRPVPLESYLDQFPELGTLETAPEDLLQAAGRIQAHFGEYSGQVQRAAVTERQPPETEVRSHASGKPDDRVLEPQSQGPEVAEPKIPEPKNRSIRYWLAVAIALLLLLTVVLWLVTK
jgi:hypothetical protein